MSTFDVTFGRHNIVVVTTDSGAANRIASAIQAEQLAGHLFQCEGHNAGVTPSDRDRPVAEAPVDFDSAIHSLTLGEVIGTIDAADDVESVRHILEAEEANPRKAGPRVSVVKRARARIEEFETADEPTDT